MRVTKVRITSHKSQTNEVQEQIPVTFTAVTDPPGYENEITWMASTKYGKCEPLTGRGPEFTTVFRNTFGVDGQWLGVKADQAQVGQDDKGQGGDGALSFAGLTHTPLGETTLKNTLLAFNIGSGGGVEIDLGGARAWSAERLTFVPSSLDWTTTLSAFDRYGSKHGRPTSSLSVREVPDDPSAGTFLLELSPTFLSPTYRVEVYSGSTLVFSGSGFSSGAMPVFSHNDPICDAIGKVDSVALGICEFVISPFFFRNENGECAWDLRRPYLMPFVIDDVTVTGDRILFVENLEGTPQYSVFTSMEVTAADTSTITVFDEHVGGFAVE